MTHHTQQYWVWNSVSYALLHMSAGLNSGVSNFSGNKIKLSGHLNSYSGLFPQITKTNAFFS